MQKDTEWALDVGSIDARLIKTLGLYLHELVSTALSVLRTSFGFFTIGTVMKTPNASLTARLGEVQVHLQKMHTAR